MVVQVFAAAIGAALAAYGFSKLNKRQQGIASAACLVAGIALVTFAVVMLTSQQPR